MKIEEEEEEKERKKEAPSPNPPNRIHSFHTLTSPHYPQLPPISRDNRLCHFRSYNAVENETHLCDGVSSIQPH